ncbi:permease [Leifsonia sp. L25]|uniref:permease n=1 Tax=Leifsonia sp. L25 TaxID=3423957 RepID=UPI003D68ED58
MTILTTITNGLSTAFFMLWGTLWALIFGFTLSGAVQAFVSRGQMQKFLGDHRPKTVARAGLFGIISSSCSYAAAALAKSLFQKGADFVTAMVFMLAATNLVVELGLVLWTLIGWQFALAEFVGGVIMIILFTLLAPRVFPTRQLAAARRRWRRMLSPSDQMTSRARAPRSRRSGSGCGAARAGRTPRDTPSQT